ncbi:type II secretion system major pseudopilin GspG [Candidatus Dependentiae bacterium]|nr:type II secretion system major pseudopilin GspG [Candidatus Dependentiae bacterium]MBU4387438.1 type II secretion system major pseudopilin GspG [Candidatus Dependentiae bacterium]MCG2756016.1 type II secretion system major pseudopilin GspG [Candidatus Dependentiae bacterium]
MKNSKAFTLIEIMVVLVIIGFIVSLIGPRIYKKFAQSERYKTEIILGKLKGAILEYKMDMGHYPKKQEGGLRALVERPNVPNNENWNGSYVDSDADLQDAWAQDFEYNCPPEKYKNKFKIFEIISVGGEMETDPTKEIIVGA